MPEERDQRRVGLRPAVLEDCCRLWGWRNDPQTREASFRTDPIPYSEHEHWFSAKIHAPGTRLFVITDPEGREVGYIRFHLKRERAEVSLSIDPSERGKGYGPLAVQAAVNRLLATEPLRQVVAFVKCSNTTSFKAFEKAGFVQRQVKTIVGTKAFEMVYPQPIPEEVLFRVEAGADIGLGHLKRSLSLAQALRQQGVQSRFLTGSDPKVAEYVGRFGWKVDRVAADPWTDKDLRVSLEVLRRHRVKAALVDGRNIPGAYLSGLKEAGFFVILRDDGGRSDLPVDLVLNGNADALQLPYPISRKGILFLLGLSYAVLPLEFWNPSPRVVRDAVERVLLLVGGDDSKNLSPRLIRLLDEVPGDFSVTAVVGPFFRNQPEVQKAAREAKRPTQIVENPDSLYSLMMEADLAISAAGQTLYELACVGCPTLAIQVAANQEGQLHALDQAGVVRRAAGASQEENLSSVLEGVGSLIRDTAFLGKMAAAGQGLVDGQGALRTARRITDLLKRSRAAA